MRDAGARVGNLNDRAILIENVPDEIPFAGLCESAAAKSKNHHNDGCKSKSPHNKHSYLSGRFVNNCRGGPPWPPSVSNPYSCFQV